MQFTGQNDGIVLCHGAIVFCLPFFCDPWVSHSGLFVPGLLAEHPQVSAQKPERHLGITRFPKLLPESELNQVSAHLQGLPSFFFGVVMHVLVLPAVA